MIEVKPITYNMTKPFLPIIVIIKLFVKGVIKYEITRCNI